MLIPGVTILSIIPGTTTAGIHPIIHPTHGTMAGVTIHGMAAPGVPHGQLAGDHHGRGAHLGVGVPPGLGAGEAAGIPSVMVPSGAETIGVLQVPARLAPMLKADCAPPLPVAVPAQTPQQAQFTMEPTMGTVPQL